MTQPVISLVCAMANNRVIGKDNEMPWHMPADLKHFKETTMGKPIVMGRKTFESIGRPLPGRRNVIITRNPKYHHDGIDVVNSVEDAITLLQDEPEIMITGGGNIYEQTLERADNLFLTFIDLDVDGDAFFPAFEHLNLEEKSREEHRPDEKNIHPYTFVNFSVIK
ncbi:type 3 dihydrofolate reductase [Pleionea sediminis]|uniref:type 3 dihydrofolate reductase n=1 Tax=Pleionea sediminis TaxID=2569479 RepID=UPI0011852475|nr:type 3 dihydrofolate reductase [Pleionea sediminis]